MTTSLFAFVWLFHPRAGGPPFYKDPLFPTRPPHSTSRIVSLPLSIINSLHGPASDRSPHISYRYNKGSIIVWAIGLGLRPGERGERRRWIMHFCGWPKIALGSARKVCAWNQQIFFRVHTYLGISMSVYQHWQAIELIKRSIFCYFKNSAFLPYFTHAQCYMSN